jgi:hypothetical protein
MTTPIDDMLQNLIEKLHAARFQDASPTIADLHQVSVALADARRMARGTASGLIEAQASRIKLLEEQNQHRIDLAFHRIERVDQLVATDKTDYRAILGAVADLSDRVKKLESPTTDEIVKGLADDMRKLAAMRDVPVTADRISTSTGDDLDEVADALGLSRKGWPYGEPEADEALRLRCAAELFRQAMTREAALALVIEANVARYPGAPRTGWSAAGWIIDAVMAAAGVHPDGRPLVAEESPVKLAERMRREFEADPAHQTREYLAQGKAKRDELTAALGYAPGSIDWQRGLDLVRETIEQRNTANAAIEAQRKRIATLEERNATQAHTIAELQSALDARGKSLEHTQTQRAAAERTVIDQAAQITALRAEVKRLVEIDGVKMTDAEVAALTGAT